MSLRAVGLTSAPDPEVLEWSARHGRVLLSHDVNTMLGFADERVRGGLHHAGVIKVPQSLAIGKAVDDLEYIAQVATPEDLRDQVLHLPL